jgi:hypothetical protein
VMVNGVSPYQAGIARRAFRGKIAGKWLKLFAEP